MAAPRGSSPGEGEAVSKRLADSAKKIKPEFAAMIPKGAPPPAIVGLINLVKEAEKAQQNQQQQQQFQQQQQMKSPRGPAHPSGMEPKGAMSPLRSGIVSPPRCAITALLSESVKSPPRALSPSPRQQPQDKLPPASPHRQVAGHQSYQPSSSSSYAHHGASKDGGKKAKAIMNVSSPMKVVHNLHVNADLEWTGMAALFEKGPKLGQGAVGSVYRAVQKGAAFQQLTNASSASSSSSSNAANSHSSNNSSSANESHEKDALKLVPIAIKEILDPELFDSVKEEVEILKKCRHPNVVSYLGIFNRGYTVWIMMDFCEWGSLRDLIERTERGLSEEQIASVCQSTLKALTYLHAMNIMHRDLKCANILLDALGIVKIADFGVSQQMTGPKKKIANEDDKEVGTALWMAPEVITGAAYDTKCDLWSLGITAIEMADTVPPHHNNDNLTRVIKLIPSRPPPTVQQPSKRKPEERASATDLLSDNFIVKSKGEQVMKAFVEELKVAKKNAKDPSSSAVEPRRPRAHLDRTKPDEMLAKSPPSLLEDSSTKPNPIACSSSSTNVMATFAAATAVSSSSSSDAVTASPRKEFITRDPSRGNHIISIAIPDSINSSGDSNSSRSNNTESANVDYALRENTGTVVYAQSPALPIALSSASSSSSSASRTSAHVTPTTSSSSIVNNDETNRDQPSGTVVYRKQSPPRVVNEESISSSKQPPQEENVPYYARENTGTVVLSSKPYPISESDSGAGGNNEVSNLSVALELSGAANNTSNASSAGNTIHSPNKWMGKPAQQREHAQGQHLLQTRSVSAYGGATSPLAQLSNVSSATPPPQVSQPAKQNPDLRSRSPSPRDSVAKSPGRALPVPPLGIPNSGTTTAASTLIASLHPTPSSPKEKPVATGDYISRTAANEMLHSAIAQLRLQMEQKYAEMMAAILREAELREKRCKQLEAEIEKLKKQQKENH